MNEKKLKSVASVLLSASMLSAFCTQTISAEKIGETVIIPNQVEPIAPSESVSGGSSGVIGFIENTESAESTETYRRLLSNNFPIEYEYKNYYVVQKGNLSAVYDADTSTFLTPYMENVYFTCTNGRYIVFHDAEVGDQYGVIDINGNIVLPMRKVLYTLGDDDIVSFTEVDEDGTRRDKRIKLPECTEIEVQKEYKDELYFYEATPFESKSEVASVTFAFGDGTCADLEVEDINELLSVLWNFSCERTLKNIVENDFSNGYYILRNADGSKSATVCDVCTVLTARFGDVTGTQLGTNQNYVLYRHMRGNASNALLTVNYSLRDKYKDAARPITDNDLPYYPENDLLSLDGCSEWASEEIKNAAAKNLLPFDLASEYKRPITRLEFCSLAMRLLGNDAAPEYDSVRSNEQAAFLVLRQTGSEEVPTYFDCSDSDVSTLSAIGIVKGVGDGLFEPERSITREEAATILHRLALYRKCGITDQLYEVSYSDINDISDWARDAVSVMSVGIMSGVGENRFSPKGVYSIEQAIATILRLSAFSSGVDYSSES